MKRLQWKPHISDSASAALRHLLSVRGKTMLGADIPLSDIPEAHYSAVYHEKIDKHKLRIARLNRIEKAAANASTDYKRRSRRIIQSYRGNIGKILNAACNPRAQFVTEIIRYLQKNGESVFAMNPGYAYIDHFNDISDSIDSETSIFYGRVRRLKRMDDCLKSWGRCIETVSQPSLLKSVVKSMFPHSKPHVIAMYSIMRELVEKIGVHRKSDIIVTKCKSRVHTVIKDENFLKSISECLDEDLLTKHIDSFLSNFVPICSTKRSGYSVHTDPELFKRVAASVSSDIVTRAANLENTLDLARSFWPEEGRIDLRIKEIKRILKINWGLINLYGK